jgi:hypothetical protein
VQIVFELTPVIGTIMGMLAEPRHLKGYQESRLREFLELVQVNQGSVARH